MKATGERWERRRWREERPERVAAVDRCQGAPPTQADVGHRNRETTNNLIYADVVELVDSLDLGSNA